MRISISRRAHVAAKSPSLDVRSALGDGLVSAQTCTSHLHGTLADYGFEDGHIRLVWDDQTGEWRAVTNYLSDKQVEPADVTKLVEFTLAQWSDGLGEGCFDEMAEATGVTINLAPLDGDDTLVVSSEETKPLKRKGQPSLDLYKAAHAGDLSTVRQLLDQGADIEFGYDGHTPLHNAVLSGFDDIALELLERGADPSATYAGFGGGEPVDALMEAALSNEITDEGAGRIAEALLKRGVDPNGERDGITPLVMAEIREKSRMAEVLRAHGATA